MKVNKQFVFIFTYAISLFVIACNSTEGPIAKPRMFPKVEFPDRNFISFDNKECDFSFEHPDYLAYGKDSIRFEENYKYPCWFDLNSKSLNTTLHFSYLKVNSQKDIDININDAFKMVNEHNIKALARKESIIENKDAKVYGLLFEIDGNVASPLQFFLTDSTQHFIRASLYFNDKVNQDSTKIIYDFIKKDIDAMINSFEWTNKSNKNIKK